MIKVAIFLKASVSLPLELINNKSPHITTKMSAYVNSCAEIELRHSPLSATPV